MCLEHSLEKYALLTDSSEDMMSLNCSSFRVNKHISPTSISRIVFHFSWLGLLMAMAPQSGSTRVAKELNPNNSPLKWPHNDIFQSVELDHSTHMFSTKFYLSS